MTSRVQALRNRTIELGLDGYLVTNLANIRYLCGYTGSNGMLLLTRDECHFYTDFRYQEQARSEVHGAKVLVRARDLIADFPVEHCQGIARLGFERAFLSYGAYTTVRKQLRKTRLVPCENLVAALRKIKNLRELALIERAAAITDKTFRGILSMVKPGVAERDLALEIDYRFRQHGDTAFETIVASGPQGALPHARPSSKKLKAGEAVVFDMGARYQGYCSDMTRTVFLGRADRKSRSLYEIVLEAQIKALGGIRAGVEARDVDTLARDHITQNGYGAQFGHGLGHGVGLEVHEAPALSGRSQDVLAAGMVTTVEPGIYLPGWGGVRIEDLIVVTKQGCRILSRSSKKLLEV